MANGNGGSNALKSFQFGPAALVASELDQTYDDITVTSIKAALINALNRIDWLESEVRRLEKKP